MTISVEHLKNYRIFKHIENKDINKFLKSIKIENINSNINIIKEGHIEDKLIFLLKGNCSVSMPLALQSKLLKNNEGVKEVFKASATDFPVFGEVFLGEGKKELLILGLQLNL